MFIYVPYLEYSYRYFSKGLDFVRARIIAAEEHCVRLCVERAVQYQPTIISVWQEY